MLLRLTNHHFNNKIMVDKLISLKGFPEDMFWQKVQGIYTLDDLDPEGKNKKEVRIGLVVKEPFEPDVTENIPDDIIEKFGEEREIYDRMDRQLLGPRKIVALRLDFSTGPGEIAWGKIWKVIDNNTGRFERVVRPAPVGNEHVWTLDVEDVPEFVLQPLPTEDTPASIQPKPVPRDEETGKPQIHCDQCSYKSDDKRAVRMHKLGKHNRHPQSVGA
jgi:hypothetical protein